MIELVLLDLELDDLVVRSKELIDLVERFAPDAVAVDEQDAIARLKHSASVGDAAFLNVANERVVLGLPEARILTNTAR